MGKFKLKSSQILIKRLCVSTLGSWEDELRLHGPAPSPNKHAILNLTRSAPCGRPPARRPWSSTSPRRSQPGERHRVAPPPHQPTGAHAALRGWKVGLGHRGERGAVGGHLGSRGGDLPPPPPPSFPAAPDRLPRARTVFLLGVLPCLSLPTTHFGNPTPHPPLPRSSLYPIVRGGP